MRTSYYIVTPSLNQLSLLKLCVASVADQKNVIIHHHVQDGGSADGTVPFLQQYALKQKKSKNNPTYTFSFESKPDFGMYSAINSAWQKAPENYDIFAYLNCDEQYLDKTLSKVAAEFNSSKADIVFGHVLFINKKNALLRYRIVVKPDENMIRLSHLSTLTAAMFVKATAVRRYELYFDSTWKTIGDAEWMLRVLNTPVRIHIANDFYSSFLESGSNLSFSKHAQIEKRKLRRGAHWSIRLGLLPIRVLHWIKKMNAGAYKTRTINYSIYQAEAFNRTHYCAHNVKGISLRAILHLYPKNSSSHEATKKNH